MEDEDDSVVALLQQFIENVQIYEPGVLLETPASRPSKEDLKSINSDTTLRMLKVLQRYVRPRNDVLRIRRAVQTAVDNGEYGSSGIYSRHSELKYDLERLKEEKMRLEEKLRTIRGKTHNNHDTRNTIMGNMLLGQNKKQVQQLQIYHDYMKLLLGNTEEVDNKTTFARTQSLATLLSPSTSARRDSSVMSEQDLLSKKEQLEQSLQSSKPKHILQSLTFLTSLSTQALTKNYPVSSPSLEPSKDKSEIEESLFPLKQTLVANAEKLTSLQNSLSLFPKKEYATTEAKCRALRAARTEALDRLDEIVSSSEPNGSHDEWNEDVNAAQELIEQHVARIKALIETYHNLRDEIELLQEEAKLASKTLLEDPRISSLESSELFRPSKLSTSLAKEIAPPPSQSISLLQLEAALQAKWKIELAQRLHEAIKTEITSSLNVIKNETLYNISLESPLLRDADILDTHLIAETWRNASLRRKDVLNDWVDKKVREGNGLLHLAERKLEEVDLLESEGQALKTLGEIVL